MYPVKNGARAPFALALALTGISLALAVPASANVPTYVLSYANSPANGYPDRSTNTPGDTVSYIGGFTDANGTNRVNEQANTDFGVNHAFASAGADSRSSGGAQSFFQIGFKLIAAAPTALQIGYSYDAVLTLPDALPAGASNSVASFRYQLGAGDSVRSAVLIDREATTQLSHIQGDHCSDRGIGDPRFCEGSHGEIGIASFLFAPGDAFINAQLNANALSGGSANAFNTARITGILVPDGVAWLYDDPALQATNPLGFHYNLAPGVPEPANWALMIMGFGLAGAAVRQGRARRLITIR